MWWLFSTGIVVVLASFDLFIFSWLILHWNQRLPNSDFSCRSTLWILPRQLLSLFSNFRPSSLFLDRMFPKLRHLCDTRNRMSKWTAISAKCLTRNKCWSVLCLSTCDFYCFCHSNFLIVSVLFNNGSSTEFALFRLHFFASDSPDPSYRSFLRKKQSM